MTNPTEWFWNTPFPGNNQDLHPPQNNQNSGFPLVERNASERPRRLSVGIIGAFVLIVVAIACFFIIRSNKASNTTSSFFTLPSRQKTQTISESSEKISRRDDVFDKCSNAIDRLVGSIDGFLDTR